MLLALIRIGSLCYNTVEQPQDLSIQEPMEGIENWECYLLLLTDILGPSDSCRTEGGPRIWTKLGQCGQ